MTSDLDIRRKQLAFRASHRGFKEADLVIGGFAAANLAAMSASELDAFDSLLCLADQDIYDWVMERARPETDEHDALIVRIRAFVRSGGAVVDRA